MSATTQVTTWLDLYTDLQNRVRQKTGVTAREDQAKRYIDQANMEIYVGTSEKLPWARRRSTITTHPEYTTGTLTATVGSQVISGSGTAWNTDNDYGQKNVRVGGKIVIDGRREVYEISAVATDGLASISPSWIGATESSLTYRYFEDEYALASDFIRPYDVTSFDDEKEIRLIGVYDFDQRFPRNRVPSTKIHSATLIDLPFDGSTTPVRKIRFAPPPSQVRIIPYSYITSSIVVSSSGTAKASFTADTDEPIIPLRYRHIIVLRALRDWYRDQRDDVRSAEVDAEMRDLLGRIVGDQEIGQQRARLSVRTGAYARAARPYRSRGARRYDVNGRFDRLEDT